MTVHHRHLRTTAAALVVGLLVLLSGCNEDAGPGDAAMGGPASSTATPEADPLAGAPSVDACYKMNIAKTVAATNNSNPVDCYADHTTLTYSVGTFPDDAVEADADVLAKECQKRLGTAMGLTKKQLVSSIFEPIYFEPTTTQWSSGARWYRCDARAESGGKLRLMPSGSTPVLYDGVPDEFTRCVDNRSGQGLYVTCNKPHDYRWTGYFQAKGSSKTYPSRANFEEQGKGCYKFTDNGAYWVTWPLEPGWSAGDRDVNCYKKTTD
jgi:hypothetical protein